MRFVAAYLLIALTVAGVVYSLWLFRRKTRREHRSVRYVIQAPDEAEDTALPSSFEPRIRPR